jgi:hypothetical protein
MWEKANKIIIRCFRVAFIFYGVLIPILTYAQPFPVNYFARLSPFQGQNIRIEISNIEDIKNGKTLTYRSVFGLTLNDPSGIGSAEDYTAMYVYVGTPNANLVSLDGTHVIPLNRLEITATAFSGLDGILVPPNFTFEIFQTNVNPVSSGFAEVFRSNRCRIQPIVYNQHLLQLTYSFGVSNKIENAAPGIYTLELQVCLCAEVDFVATCPPPF